MLRKTVNWIVLAVAIFLGMQLTVRLPGNPPADGTIDTPPEIQTTLRRACFDCHSNETRWPWYSRVAPGAWLAAHDVTLGRKEINFSEWGVYLPQTRVRKLEWMGRALDREVMPPKTYRILHPESRLSTDDIATLQRWIKAQLASLQAGTPNK